MTTRVSRTDHGQLANRAGGRQQLHDEAVSPDVRRETGHFGTPPPLAAFMAQMASIPRKTIRILDPGAGVGTLTAAVCDRIAGLRASRDVYLEMWENDPELHPHLKEIATEIKTVLEEKGHQVEFTIRDDDFILANSNSLLALPSVGGFDIAIMNPPYFKLRKEADHARAMPYVVHGQPNIYALFMAKGVELLADDGQLIAITPRSYFNGPYFKRFRHWLLDRVSLSQIHVFESRKDAFRNDAVLQENVILSALKVPPINRTARRGPVSPATTSNGSKSNSMNTVTVTSSHGRDVSVDATHRTLEYSQVVAGPDQVIRLTTSDFDQRLIDAIEHLPQRFTDLGIDISTGPVVTFRATKVLLHHMIDGEHSAPLLMMHNIRPFETLLATKNGKPSHVRVCDSSKNILLRAQRYVLIKRFTSKEERRRLVAGIVEPKHSYSPWLGLENHVNYIHKDGEGLTSAEAFGLAALFNSAALDRYLRAISGNTQVNAAEIRSLCLPDMSAIRSLGDSVKRKENREEKQMESLVADCLGLSSKMTDQLIEDL